MWKGNAWDVPAMPVEDPGAAGVRMRMLIGPERGAGNFFMRMFEVEPGGHTPRHRHPVEHEMFILEGRAVVFGGGEDHPVKAGFAVFIPPDEEHQVRNEGDAILRFLCVVPKKKG